jgi:hypothetical protein
MFEFYHPSTSTSNPPTLQQGMVHLSDDSDIEYGVTDEEMAKDFQDKNFRKNFHLLTAQEIVKFNANLEERSSQVQNYPSL